MNDMTAPTSSETSIKNLASGLQMQIPEDQRDERFEEIAEHIIKTGRASTNYLQKTFAIGYSRAAALIDQFENLGVVGAADHLGKRIVWDAPTIRASLRAATREQEAPALIPARREGAKANVDPLMKETDADREVRDRAYRVTAGELRSFVERFERLDAEKKDIADQQKEVMAEAKGRGYDTKALRKLIALRKREPDDIAEEEAVLGMYKEALGMA